MVSPKSLGVQLIRLKTGDDIVADVIYDPSESRPYQMVEPLKVAYMKSTKNPGYMTVSLVQWVFPGLTDGITFPIAENDILFITDSSDKMTDYYVSTLNSFHDAMNAKIEMESGYDTESKPSPNDISEDDLDYLEAVFESLKKDKGSLH